jgi:hypothetical protein
MTIENTIKDLRSECQCEHIEYCPLYELVRHSSSRLISQHKCVEKLKYLESKKTGYDIGWTQAYIMWVDLGYAKAFAEVYKEGMMHNEIYEKMLEKLNQLILTDKDIIK